METNHSMECRKHSLFEVTPERLKAGLETSEQVRHEILWEYARGGDAPAGLLGHLAECAACRQLASSFEQLHGALTRTDKHVFAVCPSPETLAGYREGMLAASEREKVGTHLEACRPCRDDLDWMSRTADPPKVVAMTRRRWIAVAAAAAALVVVSVAPQVMKKGSQPAFTDLAEAPLLDKEDLRATLTQRDRFLPALEASFVSYESGDFSGAETKAREILAAEPSEPSGLMMAAMAAYRRGHVAEAAKLAEAAERVKKSEYRCWTALQFALMTGNRPGIDRECRHMVGHTKYENRAGEILKTVQQRTASLPRVS